jgi:MFS transporter, CP family, cyanate transporter
VQLLPLLPALALLWLVGIALRLAILAVPPVIPLLRDEFRLTGTDIGILSGLPVILFAVAALAGSRLVARIGVVAAVVAGLLLTALGSALRAGASHVLLLFAATVVMGVGVAVTQPAMPALVGRWLPQRIVLGTGVYTNGLLVGEILPVGLFPVLYPMLGESWRATFVLWALPIVAIAGLILTLAPRNGGDAITVSARWFPDWRARDIWRLGLIFGGVGPFYFGSNAFLPGYLKEVGRPDLISPALTALNLGQLPASLLLIGFARHIESRAWPFVLASVLGLVGVGGVVVTAGVLTVASAALLGFAAGAAFALGLTLPPLLSTSDEVARVSAAMFTISYAMTVVVAIVCGAIWDFTGTARLTFLPIALAALPSIVLAPTIRFDRKTARGRAP